ncbi:hypothetical protein PFISCL1PPCAC_369 [Pristionchus fissidentatus]|uniref:NET domain-containing protein n=1 Tax=Pristionchus fissidentatus TaxID=1538716 RepID=A0AAV5US63_9BILA|nr:hypothetical protein PFISCL1PPCAC_369 [Pristionchus fissidentatus]
MEKTMQIPNYSFDSGDEESRQPMTYNELKTLAIRINKMPREGLATVVGIVDRREYQGNANFNPEDIDIDFEALLPITVRELEAFVNAFAPAKAAAAAETTPAAVPVAAASTSIPAAVVPVTDLAAPVAAESTSVHYAAAPVAAAAAPAPAMYWSDSSAAPLPYQYNQPIIEDDRPTNPFDQLDTEQMPLNFY